MNRRVFWMLLPTLMGIVLLFGQSLPLMQPEAPADLWVWPAFVVMLAGTLLIVLPNPLRHKAAQVIHTLRRAPLLLWLGMLIYWCWFIGLWVIQYQPCYDKLLKPVEYCWLLFHLWVTTIVLWFDLDAEEMRSIGRGIAQSRWSGVLISLTTILILFWLAEGWMRLFYVTTDAYQFTTMNYHWYQNFYVGHENWLGYRDDAPRPDDPATPFTRVVVLGDSFAVGHGINNVEDIFANQLQARLGSGYEVNLVAQTGWESGIEAFYLNHFDGHFPLDQDVVILSYFLNDVDALIPPERAPARAFSFPDNPITYWAVINFFVPNYAYYNVMQYTSAERSAAFNQNLFAAYEDETIWAQHTQVLQEGIINWTAAHNSRLIVLLWPHLVAMDQSQPAVQRVQEFFTSQGGLVVDMTPVLSALPVQRRIVNAFDSHPSMEAHRLAAEALYQAISRQAAASTR